ncbi:hypothetical protein LMTR3_21145 [Bradyrhizobium sp. LMTR 3]|nr:hypothetical protein LMTR3_21145 [Bradyrhizobium sp. LMTR 3]
MAIDVSELLKVTSLANELKRQGREVIVLKSREAGFDTPNHLHEVPKRAMYATKYTALERSSC